VNLLLLEVDENARLLGPEDRRTRHIMRILGKKTGDFVEAGLISHEPFGPAPDSLGTARIRRLDGEGLIVDYLPDREAAPLYPLRLILGFPRPIQASRVLKDLTSLGLAEIILTGTELGEKSYLESDFWKKGGYERSLVEGAEQAANPRLPRVLRSWTLARALDEIEARDAPRGWGEPDWDSGSLLILDPRTPIPPMGQLELTAPVTLAIGSERGWTDSELRTLSARGFRSVSLGPRILKTETAALVGSAIALARIGRL